MSGSGPTQTQTLRFLLESILKTILFLLQVGGKHLSWIERGDKDVYVYKHGYFIYYGFDCIHCFCDQHTLGWPVVYYQH